MNDIYGKGYQALTESKHLREDTHTYCAWRHHLIARISLRIRNSSQCTADEWEGMVQTPGGGDYHHWPRGWRARQSLIERASPWANWDTCWRLVRLPGLEPLNQQILQSEERITTTKPNSDPKCKTQVCHGHVKSREHALLSCQANQRLKMLELFQGFASGLDEQVLCSAETFTRCRWRHWAKASLTHYPFIHMNARAKIEQL